MADAPQRLPTTTHVHTRPAEPSAGIPAAWIFAELAPHRWSVALLAGLSGLEVALRMLLPWPLKAMVDHIAGHLPLTPATAAWLETLLGLAGLVHADPRLQLLLAIIGAGLVISLAHQLVLLAHSHLQTKLAVRLVRALREQLFAHLQALALVHHDRRTTGDTVYRLESDAGCIEQLTLRGVFPFVFSAVTLLAMLAVLIALDWRLALASLAVVPLMFGWMRWRTRRIAQHAQAAKQAEAAMVSHAFESLSAIRLVKSFAQESFERRRFSRAAGDVMEARLVAAGQDAMFSVGIGALMAAGTTIVLGLGGYFVLTGTTTAGTLLVALTYLGFVYGPLTGIANTMGSIQHALASADRVHDTLRLPREDEHRRTVTAPRFAGHVEYRHVGFAFDEGPPVLGNVSFKAAPGEMIAVVGPSGSGKTTLMSLMPRLREASSGSILIDGRDISQLSVKSLRRQIAVVLQDAVVLSGTVADNLRYGRLSATREEIEAAARLAHAHEFIMALPDGYDTTLAEAGRSLSGGQRQRLSIARAFLKDAPIIIFDEPTAALDAVSESAIVDALHRLRVDRTVFVIAHRLTTVRDADRILVLDRGSVAAEGRHEDLLVRSDLYRRLATGMVDERSMRSAS